MDILDWFLYGDGYYIWLKLFLVQCFTPFQDGILKIALVVTAKIAQFVWLIYINDFILEQLTKYTQD